MEILDVTNELTRHEVKLYAVRDYSDIDTIVIHHSATMTGSAESYARYHVNNNNWAGIGYHYVIEQNGDIKQTNHLKSKSYHARNYNTRSIGICLTGDYDKQFLSGKMLDSLVFLLKDIKLFFAHKDLKIIGHRDVSSKTCPGNNISLELIKSLCQ